MSTRERDPPDRLGSSLELVNRTLDRSVCTRVILARTLWARTRVAGLSDWNPDGLSTIQRQEVTSLGLKYSLLTNYTSFIAVYHAPRNLTGAAKDVAQPLPLPQGVSDHAVGNAMGVGAEPELIVLLCGLALILAAAWWERTSRRRIKSHGL